MKSTLMLYQVCDNTNGFFDPIGASMEPNQHQALAELREMRERYPQAYLAQVVFTRCPDLQQGQACLVEGYADALIERVNKAQTTPGLTAK